MKTFNDLTIDDTLYIIKRDEYRRPYIVKTDEIIVIARKLNGVLSITYQQDKKVYCGDANGNMSYYRNPNYAVLSDERCAYSELNRMLSEWKTEVLGLIEHIEEEVPAPVKPTLLFEVICPYCNANKQTNIIANVEECVSCGAFFDVEVEE
jgi:hypothetical protein